ncbi:MAG: M14 family zinc carboxypeptidase [Promethearchaeota archaeon]
MNNIDLNKILDQIPEYKEFMTISELNNSSRMLAEEFVNVELKELGKTGEGRPIYCLKIGQGKKNALLFAFPHPNEPIGSMSLEFFSRYLAENPEFTEQTGYTWYIIKAIDVDGAVLNEGWFKGEFNPIKYARNYYRPAAYEQVEWSFPIKYKKLEFETPPPETQALMSLMQDLKPKFMYSLHNSGFGGVYFYVTRGVGNMFSELIEFVQDENLPLHLGEPEVPFIKVLHEAVFELFGIQEQYDFIESNGIENPQNIIQCGTSSDDYLKTVIGNKSMVLVCEMPYFYDEAIEDLSQTEFERRDLRIKLIEHLRELYNHSKKVFRSIKKYCKKNTKLYHAADYQIKNGGLMIEVYMQDAKTSPMYDGKATVSQAFDSNIASRYYPLLTISMLVRLCQEAISNHPEKKLELMKIKSDLEKYIETRINELLQYTKFEVIAIQKLVRVQIGSALITLENLSKN